MPRPRSDHRPDHRTDNPQDHRHDNLARHSSAILCGTEGGPGADGRRLRAAAAVAALVALLVGVPVAFGVLVGWPLPRSILTAEGVRGAVDQQLPWEAAVKAIVCLAWLAWAQLVVCVAVEPRAALTEVSRGPLTTRPGAARAPPTAAGVAVGRRPTADLPRPLSDAAGDYTRGPAEGAVTDPGAARGRQRGRRRLLSHSAG
jgi:hypothetical protein